MVCTCSGIPEILKNMEIESFASTWMHLKHITLGEMHQSMRANIV